VARNAPAPCSPEIRPQPLVDLDNTRIDGDQTRPVRRLGDLVAFVGRLGHGRDAHRVALLPFLKQVLALAHQRAETLVALGAASCHLGQRAGSLRA